MNSHTLTLFHPAPAAPEGSHPPAPEPAVLDQLGAVGVDLTRFFLEYKFGIAEVRTKVSILQEEFVALHEYNPIEHVSSRLKSAESIARKLARKGLHPSLDVARSSITDVAGLRITCSFVSDVHRVLEMLRGQPDLTVLQIKDYIAAPKGNGYRSMHLLVTVPVFLSASVVNVPVEIQIRTVAMDFWASTEHKIHYKFQTDVPGQVRTQLREAAETAHRLDSLMEQLHLTVHAADRLAPAG